MSALFIGKYRSSEQVELIDNLFSAASSSENRENIRKLIIETLESENEIVQQPRSHFKIENRMIGDTQDMRELSMIGCLIRT